MFRIVLPAALAACLLAAAGLAPEAGPGAAAESLPG